jgi:hypothetical protein
LEKLAEEAGFFVWGILYVWRKLVWVKRILLSILFIVFGIEWIMGQAPTIQWEKSFGGSSYDVARSLQQTYDGGYIIAGFSDSNNGDVTGNHGFRDCWIIKIDNSGVIEWQKSLGGNISEEAYSIIQTADSNYVFAAYSSSNNGDVSGNHGSADYWIVKLNNSGSIVWQKCLGGTGDDQSRTIEQTYDGGFIVAGNSFSNDGDVTGNHGAADIWIVKLNNNGSLQWQKSLGGSGYDFASSIKLTTDSGYVIAGYTTSNNGDVSGNHSFDYDYWIVKLNNSGNIQWQKCLGGTNEDRAYSASTTNDGGYVVSGYSLSNNGDVSGNHSNDYDAWVVKLDNSGIIQWQKCLGGTSHDVSYSIIQNTNGQIIQIGITDSNNGDVSGNHGGDDLWAVCLSDSGAINWQKCFGGSSGDIGYCIKQDAYGGYIMAGISWSSDGDVSINHGIDDYWIVKLNPLTNKEEMIFDIALKCSPNPTTSAFTITLKSQSSIKNFQLHITDLAGRVVYGQILNQRSEVINRNFSAGIYFVRVRDGEKVYTQKLVVE